MASRLEHSCPICSKCFDRRDTLIRHIRIHSRQRPPPKPRRRSCLACTRSKIKCLAERPSCSSCIRRGTTCMYEHGTSNTTQPSNLLSPPYGSVGTEQMPTPPQAEINNSFTPDTDFLSAPSASVEFPMTEGYPDTIDNLSGVNIDWNLEWIFNSKFDESFQPIEPSVSVDNGPDNSPDRFSEGNDAGIECSTPLYNEQHMNTELSERNAGQLHSRYQHRRGSNGTWPVDWKAGPGRISTLPALGALDQDFKALKHFPTLSITESTIAGLQDSFNLHLAKSPWKPVSLAGFPSKEKIDHCIDMYFKYFDWILPVVHRPTFDPGKDPVVTLAIIATGACYTEFKGARAFSNVLSELLRRLLLYMAESDAPYVKTEPYITAQLLQAAQGYGSGSKKLFDLSESWRSSLVYNARCMGLFRQRQSTIVAGASLEERWQAWINDERFRRIGWAVYGCDCSASYLYNTRSYISVSDINMDLQSSTEHWEAPTAQAWAALHPWSTSGPRNLHFKTVIRSVLAGDEAASRSMTDDHHRIPFILTIMRMLWSCNENDANPMSDILDERQRNARNRKYLLEVVDRFIYLPTDSPAVYTQLSRMDAVHRVMTIHIAHLIGAGNMMDWLYSLLRGGPEAENARTRMERWAAQDPVRVREVAYRSSQILSLIRQYPYNLPQEPFDAFHAGAILWCVAEFLPGGDLTYNSSDAHATLSVCHLDHLGNMGDLETASTKAWIRDGGPRIISLYGVPDLCCKAGRQQILDQTITILGRSRVWGISQNFLEVISGLREYDDASC
ncbi:hypothetical protein F5884DRAFT_772680 [Xylogone sp. PMI_703]|nr:hypothetical protein F5884DRAFT_772680 [Xylogone sp. PMI_703]